MAISIEQIKSLRDKTGVSTTQCKKALDEADGDEQKAIELLRKKGAAKAAAREGEAGEGVVAISVSDDHKVAAMVMVKSETDFVAKNKDFVAGSQSIADEIRECGEDTDCSRHIDDLATKMAEKIEMGSIEVMEVEGGIIGTYVHTNNKIGAMVQLMSTDDVDLGRDIAMHLVANKPKNVSPDDVEQSMIDSEITIWKEQLAEEGKPENIWDKILSGKEKKFREENALLTQPFVKNPESTVGQLLDSEGAEVGDFMVFEI